ncbi:hypothetical protein Tco_1130179 [Tanacetum coccineum]
MREDGLRTSRKEASMDGWNSGSRSQPDFRQEEHASKPNINNQDCKKGQRNSRGFQGKMDCGNKLHRGCSGGHEDVLIHGCTQVSEEAFASTELPKGEASEVVRKSIGPVRRREDRFHKEGYGTDRRRNEGRNSFNHRDGLAPGRTQTPYQTQRDQGIHPKFNLNSLTKLSREILISEPQLNLQPPKPMQLPPKKENQDRYCDYHGEKGYYTNDCFQLRKQLEIALESGRLNHLIKDVRQRGRGNTKGRETRKDKVINILEAVMEGYLVRRVYVDQGALVQVMFEHSFENLSPTIKSRLRST